jgi:hypothetical protein
MLIAAGQRAPALPIDGARVLSYRDRYRSSCFGDGPAQYASVEELRKREPGALDAFDASG